MAGETLHVVLVTPAYPPKIGGIASYVRDLATALVELGNRVSVVFADDAAEWDDVRVDGHLRVLRLAPHWGWFERTAMRASGLTQAAWAVRVARSVRRLKHEDHVDVVEAPNWKALGSVLSLWKPAPLITRVSTGIAQLTDPEVRGELLAGRLHRVERFTVRRSDRILVPAAGHWRVCAPGYGCRAEVAGRVRCIPFGIPPLPDPPVPHPGVAGHVLFVGRLSWRKGFDSFVAALPRILSGLPSSTRVLVAGEPASGGGSWDESIGELTTECKKRVHYLGPVTDARLGELLGTARVVVVPSRYESFGLVYLEAMARGVPVVGCRVGGVPEVVLDGRTGFLVPAGEAGRLADAVIRVGTDDRLWEQFSGAAREHARRFTHDAMARSTLAVYREVCGRRT